LAHHSQKKETLVTPQNRRLYFELYSSSPLAHLLHTFHPSVPSSVPSSIHPSSSSLKKKMTEEEEEEKLLKLQTNFLKLKIIEKKKRNKRRNLFKTTQAISN
jgi:hypothetical protein